MTLATNASFKLPWAALAARLRSSSATSKLSSLRPIPRAVKIGERGALAGAHRLQLRNGRSPVGGVLAFAASNSAFGSAIALDDDDVEAGFWNPYTSTFSSTSWALANSVRVTARATPTLAFGRLLNRGSLTATRSAVAWIANQSARDCIKPWALDAAFGSMVARA